MTAQKNEVFVVKAGSLTLGRTTDYNEAVRWMKSHDSMKAPGSPYARIMEVAWMVTFSPGMKISAVYYTSVYKFNISGWRSEKVTAILEVISPGMAIVRSATMEPGGSKRQHYNVAKAEADEIGKKKIISKLDKVEVA